MQAPLFPDPPDWAFTVSAECSRANVDELWVPSLVPAARGRPKKVELLGFDDISSSSDEEEELNYDEFAQNVDSYFSSLPEDADLSLPLSEPADFARLMESIPTAPIKVNTPTVLFTQPPAAVNMPTAEEKEAAQKVYNDMAQARRERQEKEIHQQELDTFFMYGMITGVFIVSAGVFAYFMLVKKPAEIAPKTAALPPRGPPPYMRSAPPAMPAYY